MIKSVWGKLRNANRRAIRNEPHDAPASPASLPGVHRDSRFERLNDTPLSALHASVSRQPLLSVIMTSFNTSAWIEAAVGSILRQTWGHLELIVVDDDSRDDSVSRVEAIGARDPRVRILRMPSNVGTYRARNAGLLQARGEVLTFMDSDDTSDPTRLEKQLALLRTPGLVATTCNYLRHNAGGDVILNRGLRERQALISLMFKREVLDDIGWFDPVRTSADDEFFERLRFVYGRNSHANVAEPLYRALSRSGSLSTAPHNAANLSTGSESGDSLSPARRAYVSGYRAWHEALRVEGARPFMPLECDGRRPFAIDARLTDQPADASGIRLRPVG